MRIDEKDLTVVKLHALSVYKKHLYKKQLVEFLKNKKQWLVNFWHAKKHFSNTKIIKSGKIDDNA